MALRSGNSDTRKAAPDSRAAERAGRYRPAPACPMPGSPAAAPPDPRPVPSVRGDYDADDDGLIEVATLAQLDAMRYDLNGEGKPSNQLFYYAAFPNAVAGMGCPDGVCAGYELVVDLDFDTNGNGQADSGDEYWDDGAGWLPIGSSVKESLFCTTFRRWRSYHFQPVHQSGPRDIITIETSIPVSVYLGYSSADPFVASACSTVNVHRLFQRSEAWSGITAPGGDY